MHPESLMMSAAYLPSLSDGTVKPPIFQASTFVFDTAEQGKDFFEIAYGHRQKRSDEKMGYIYSRISNPNLKILEDRLRIWDKADDCAVFASGMSAITTVFLEFLKPGDLLLMSSPVYGGTDHFAKNVLKKYGVRLIEFKPWHSQQEVIKMVEDSGASDKLSLIYVETPANPTNDLFDIAMAAQIARHFSSPEKAVYLAIDNTYMGPLWQRPIQHGADLVLYSATKHIGGHSDVIAGACSGKAELMNRVKAMRTFLGNMASPYSSWLLMRSLETLKIRMSAEAQNAEKVAEFLNQHPKVEKVYYLGNLTSEKGKQYEIKQRQCTSNGAMISFDVKGGEKSAFQLLNALKLIKLAVSLGGTESLAEHPATMTHVDVDEQLRAELSVTEKMVRLSVGIENHEDIIEDLRQALDQVE